MWSNSKIRSSTKILKYFTLATQLFFVSVPSYSEFFHPVLRLLGVSRPWWANHVSYSFRTVHDSFLEPPNYVYFDIIPISFGTSDNNIFLWPFQALLSLLQQSIFIGLLLPRKFIQYLQDGLWVCLLDGVLHHLSAPRPNISSLSSGRQIRQFAAAVMLRGSGGGGGRRTTHLGIPAKKWGFSIEATVWATKHFEI